MKRALIASAILAAVVSVPAMAADLPVKAPMVKAPPPVYNWTGCYLGGGWGYGFWTQDSGLITTAGVPLTLSVRSGGRGWFGTVTGGCDYEFNQQFFFGNLLIGAFADGDWGSLSGNAFTWIAPEKEKSAWAVGGRVGLVVSPNILTYWNGGYTEARFDGFEIVLPSGFDTGLNVSSHTYTGYFLGGGVEYQFSSWPGLFWRNEYRWATYRADNILELVTATGAATATVFNAKKDVSTVRSELIWRFNWGGGGVSARY
jgi:outer membrane immunogenic protein